MTSPKLFISYCWTSESHQEWVINLATKLIESGVNVILDVWDLKVGQDAHVFMESMVSDPSVTKVLIISNKEYVERATHRKGGVGTETQIISSEIYSQHDQNKFVAAARERKENGELYMPVYYRSRIHINLADDDRFSDSLEEILRWAFDKPLHQRPELGKPPAYLFDESSISLGTSAAFDRACNSLRENKANSLGALREYLHIFSENIDKFRIIEKTDHIDDDVIKSIEQFLPYRNEILQLLEVMLNYTSSLDPIKCIHHFFESIAHYTEHNQINTSINKLEFDNFKFIIYELFLYVIATLIKKEKFKELSYLLSKPFYIKYKNSYNSPATRSYCFFRLFPSAIEERNKRLNLRRIDLLSDLIKERSSNSGMQFEDLMQADLILYLRASLLYGAHQNNERWFPRTLLYYAISYHGGPFEVFARSKSSSYAKENLLVALGIDDLKQLDALLQEIRAHGIEPKWDGGCYHLDLESAVRPKDLGSVP